MRVPVMMGATTLRRLARDRTAAFFMVLLPVVIIVVMGTSLTGFDTFSVGVVVEGEGPVTDELVRAVEGTETLDTARYADRDEALASLRRAELMAVVVVPAGFDEAARAGAAVVSVYGDQASGGVQAALSAVSGTVSEVSTRVAAATFTAAVVGGAVEDHLATVQQVGRAAGSIGVDVEVVDGESSFLPEGFSYSAPTMLVLFVFITSLAGGGATILETRRLGIYERMLAGPVRARQLVMGETLAHLLVALVQSALIVGVGALVFGVEWGDPVAALVLVLVWALVGTGFGVLAGTTFATSEQAGSIGPPIGIALGMLGGCMWPLEIVPDWLATIGLATPHAWAVEGWTELLSRGGGLADLALPLGILAAFAAAVITLATTRLHTRLVP